MAVGVCVGVAVGVSVGVVVGVLVGVIVGVSVGVGVTVGVSVGVAVGVLVGVLVDVGVWVGVIVGVSVGVIVGVSVGVSVGVADGVAAGMLAPNASRAPRPPVLLLRAVSIRALRLRSESRARVIESYQLPPRKPVPCAVVFGQELTSASPPALSTPFPWSDPLNALPVEFPTVTTRSHRLPERSIAP